MEVVKIFSAKAHYINILYYKVSYILKTLALNISK